MHFWVNRKMKESTNQPTNKNNNCNRSATHRPRTLQIRMTITDETENMQFHLLCQTFWAVVMPVAAVCVCVCSCPRWYDAFKYNFTWHTASFCLCNFIRSLESHQIHPLSAPIRTHTLNALFIAVFISRFNFFSSSSSSTSFLLYVCSVRWVKKRTALTIAKGRKDIHSKLIMFCAYPVAEKMTVLFI